MYMASLKCPVREMSIGYSPRNTLPMHRQYLELEAAIVLAWTDRWQCFENGCVRC